MAKVLELTLVKSNGLTSRMYTFLERTRYQINDDSDLMKCIIKFLGDNADILRSAFSDNEDFVSKVINLQTLNSEELKCLNYVLDKNAGLKLLYWIVEESETNGRIIEPGTFEFNVVNNVYGYTVITRLCTKKILSKQTIKFSDLYEWICREYNLFGGNLFTEFNNPIMADVEAMRGLADYIGAPDDNIVQHIESILKYMGFEIHCITE